MTGNRPFDRGDLLDRREFVRTASGILVGALGSSCGRSAGSAVTPPPEGVVFASDWSTALGTTTAAKTDGGNWDILSDSGAGLEVIASTGLGFPSPNCLRVTAKQASTGFHRLAKTGLGVVAAGGSVWYRWYYRQELGLFSGASSQHPVESGQTGGLDWAFNTHHDSNTQWRADFQSLGNTGNWRQRWRAPILDNGVLYRIEMRLHKLSSTTWNLHVRVYDAAGTLIRTDADYTNLFSSDGVSADTVSLADNPTLNFSTGEGSQMDELRAGCNGVGGTAWFPSALYAYQGCFAVSRSDWLGPYNASSGV